jgi:hypothetical protein
MTNTADEAAFKHYLQKNLYRLVAKDAIEAFKCVWLAAVKYAREDQRRIDAEVARNCAIRGNDDSEVAGYLACKQEIAKAIQAGGGENG